MKIMDTIKENSIKLLLSGLFGVLGFLIGSMYHEIPPTFLQTILEPISKLLLLKLLIAATIGIVLVTALALYFYLQSRDKLVPKFGVLWDKNKEAYCPACRIPLSHYVTWRPEHPEATRTKAFQCIKCDKQIHIIHNTDNIELDDARKML